jgi:MFS family permease
LAGRYPAAALMVIFALIPYLALSAAAGPLTPIIGHDLHMSLQSMSLAFGMGNAGYAAGTVLAVVLAQHLPQRRMLVVYAVLLVIGSFMTAAAQDAPMFFIGHILQGVCTSLLLIAAVPALTVAYGSDKLRYTAMIMNMCIFGAVAIGPAIGGIQAHANAWRPLFLIIAMLSLCALLLVVLTFEDAPAADKTAPWDPPAIALAIIGPAAAFFGASELFAHRFLALSTTLPLAIGLALIVTLVAYQYRAKRPLLTIRDMLRSSMPVAGLVVALFAAAASVSATELTASVSPFGPIKLGLLYLPELGGAVLTAFALGVVLRTRAMHYLPLAGMVFLAAGIAVFRIQVPSSAAGTLIGSGLTGIGLGATVAPALFVAGFSLPSANLQRVFALVELLRACAAFMIAPIFAHMAATVGGNLRTGTGIALWIGLGLAVGGAVIGVLIYALSGARPQAADIDGFIDGDDAAWYSPPLLEKLHQRPRSGVLVEEPVAG